MVGCLKILLVLFKKNTVAQLTSKIKKYTEIISDYVTEVGTYFRDALGASLEYEAICDKQNKHFQLVRLGWSENDFFYQILFHIDIKPDGKVWIQKNSTEIGVGAALIKKGVDKSDLVLGFRSPAMRALTHFAV